jgi:hypothetical protein
MEYFCGQPCPHQAISWLDPEFSGYGLLVFLDGKGTVFQFRVSSSRFRTGEGISVAAFGVDQIRPPYPAVQVFVLGEGADEVGKALVYF